MSEKKQIILEPTTAQFMKKLEALKAPPIYTESFDKARAILENLQAVPTHLPPVTVEHHTIEAGPTGSLLIRIIRPAVNNNPLPVGMYFHGAGWIMGSFQTHERLAKEIAHAAQIAVVFVDYTLSPEAQFPIPIEQAYAATKYVAEHGKELNLKSEHLAVIGDSVGGNMATVVCLIAKERGGPKIACQILLYPVTDANFETPSYIEFANGPWLTKESMKWFWHAYAPQEKDRLSHFASPLRSSLDLLKGLPQALIITNEYDVLRDEGEAYAHRLIEAGVNVMAVRCLGTMHDMAMLNAIAQAPAARLAVDLVAMKLKSVF
jgi:acetyl esterase